MRTIKFRGKDTEYGTCKYGSLVITDDDKNDPFRTNPIKKAFHIVCYNQGDWNMGVWDYVNVDSDSIGQFTGLYDKNGKEVYEGDIIGYDEDPTVRHLIFYSDNQARFMAGLNGETNLCNFGVCSIDKEWMSQKVVLGNIIENPELLR